MIIEDLKQKVSVIISSDKSGNDKRDALLKLIEELSHPQPAEVSANTAKQILEKHVKVRGLLDFGNYSCVGIPYEDALNALKESISLSPPPVRHMSDEELQEKLAYNNSTHPRFIQYKYDSERRIEGAKFYRSFIQCQQPEQGSKPAQKWPANDDEWDILHEKYVTAMKISADKGTYEHLQNAFNWFKSYTQQNG